MKITIYGNIRAFKRTFIDKDGQERPYYKLRDMDTGEEFSIDEKNAKLVNKLKKAEPNCDIEVNLVEGKIKEPVTDFGELI